MLRFRATWRTPVHLHSGSTALPRARLSMADEFRDYGIFLFDRSELSEDEVAMHEG
jgi:hypothetical protein